MFATVAGGKWTDMCKYNLETYFCTETWSNHNPYRIGVGVQDYWVVAAVAVLKFDERLKPELGVIYWLIADRWLSIHIHRTFFGGLLTWTLLR